MISEFVELFEKGGLIHLFLNRSHCSKWHGCSVAGSFPSLKQLLKPNDEYDSGMIYHSVCIIDTERVWMNTTLAFNVFVWGVWKRHINHIDSFDTTMCYSWEWDNNNNKQQEQWEMKTNES